MKVSREHPVRIAGLFRRLAAGWRSSSRPFSGDDFLEAFDAKLCKRGNAVFTDAVDPQRSVFGLHVDAELPEPFHVLAEHLGDVIDGEDVGDGSHDHAAWLARCSGDRQFHGSSSWRL
jgi:hypothetical protein